jgi:hypothetical protein
VLYLWLIILTVGDDAPVDSKTFLVTDFMNIKIKSAQSFRCAHRSSVYVFIGVRWSSVYKYLYLYCVYKKI